MPSLTQNIQKTHTHAPTSTSARARHHERKYFRATHPKSHKTTPPHACSRLWALFPSQRQNFLILGSRGLAVGGVVMSRAALPLPPPPYVGVHGTLLVEQDPTTTMQPGLEPTQLSVHTGNAAPLPVTNSGPMDSDGAVGTAAQPAPKKKRKKRHSGSQQAKLHVTL